MPVIRLAGKQDELFAFPALMLDEFVPVVQVDRKNFLSDNVAAILEKKAFLELSDKIEEGKRRVDLITIVAAPGKMTIPFTVEKGVRTLDDDGCIKPKLNATTKGVVVAPSGRSKASFGKPFEVTVDILGSEKRSFFVELYAEDDADDVNQGELKEVFCGKVGIEVYPDVFSEYECNQLIDEINFIQPFADAGAPSEYASNYCMSAAERGLSKLLGNTTDFYSVDRSHKRLNSISFKGLGANDRGTYFRSLGYVQTSFVFDEYQINHALRKNTKCDADFTANMYKVVTLTAGSELKRQLDESIDGKRGFHIFYVSISDGYHTLLLIIDNRNAGSEVYALYDQHGMTSSHGNFVDIETGFARQTSWTFLDYYTYRGYDPKIYGRVTTRVWKIQRKL